MDYFVIEKDPAGTVAVDDTILIKGCETKAGSHILDSFVPLFDADCVERVAQAGLRIKGKTHTGEFGLDLAGESSYHGVCRKADGSLSTAAAEAVAAGEVKQALCVDVNGAPRRGACLSGVDFIKPTYGTVSRYGIIPTACSGEQVGVCAADVRGAMELLGVIAGHDSRDGTSLGGQQYHYSADRKISEMKIAAVQELYDAAEDALRDRMDRYMQQLSAQGAEVSFVSIPEMKHYATAWQMMFSAETCNNLSRYDGVKFGYRAPSYKDIDELYVNSRTDALGFTAKANILLGSHVLSKNKYLSCYDKSLRIRRLASEKMKALFAQYDALLCPVMSTASLEECRETEIFERVEKEMLFTAVPNLTGIPALVTGGVQLWSAAFGENVLFSIAAGMEGVENHEV